MIINTIQYVLGQLSLKKNGADPDQTAPKGAVGSGSS